MMKWSFFSLIFGVLQIIVYGKRQKRVKNWLLIKNQLTFYHQPLPPPLFHPLVPAYPPPGAPYVVAGTPYEELTPVEYPLLTPPE